MDRTGLLDFFRDFDSPQYYAEFEEALLQEKTENFFIGFDSKKAFGAFDLSLENIDALNKLDWSPMDSARWINIFAPNRQKDIVQSIARKYRFSPRLAAIMSSKQDSPTSVPKAPAPAKPSFELRHPLKRLSFQFHNHTSDPEKTDYYNSSAADAATTLDLSHYKLINEVWHYSSIDQGPKYFCIGYNSLPNVTESRKQGVQQGESASGQNDGDGIDFGSSNLPMGKRVWSWLVICYDGKQVQTSA